MQRIASQVIWRIGLSFLSLLPGLALAGNSAPEDFLSSKSLVLDVRYCQCQASETDSLPSALLPDFLKESSVLRIGVSSAETGFASSDTLSIGYELKPVTGSPDQLHFRYSGTYTTSKGSSAGSGELLLIQGQWVNLFGSQHETETGSQYSNVVVRLAKPSGS